MKGKYEIRLYNNKVHYHLTIKRNITIFQGDSESGKSEMLRLLTAYNNRLESSGVTLICEKTCTVLTEEDWELRLSGYHDRIIFIDEGNLFLRSKRFAKYVKQSNNYFVIIYRDSLYELPYSIEEIYADILEVPSDVLEQTFNHADSARYFSWEEYYTQYLTEISQNTVYQYSKKKLSQSYLTAGNVSKIKSTIPDRIDIS